MVYGLLCSESGVSDGCVSLAIAKMLNEYGYPTTLRAISVTLAILSGPLIPLLNGRLPPASQNSLERTD